MLLLGFQRYEFREMNEKELLFVFLHVNDYI